MKDSKGAKSMTGEQEVILSTKKEMEQLYKDFVNYGFRDELDGTSPFLPSLDKQAAQAQRSAIEKKINDVLEHLSDFCDDQLCSQMRTLLKPNTAAHPPPAHPVLSTHPVPPTRPVPASKKEEKKPGIPLSSLPDPAYIKRVGQNPSSISPSPAPAAVPMPKHSTPVRSGVPEAVAKPSPMAKHVVNGPVRILHHGAK